MIRGFVGPNGSGKSLAMTAAMALPSWREGRVVVANFKLYPERAGFDPQLYVPLETWRQIPRLGRHPEEPGRSLTYDRPACLLLDEITAVLPSRQAMNVPGELLRVLNQFRKPDVIVGWSAPAWARADLVLRECTMLVTLCQGRKGDPWVRDANGKAQRDQRGRKVPHRSVWPANRLFTWSTYDATSFEEFNLDAAKQERLAPIVVRRYWRPRGWSWPPAGGELKGAHNFYNTDEKVMLLDHVEAGDCVHCGGKKKARRCECPDEVGDEVKARAIRVLGPESTRAVAAKTNGVVRIPNPRFKL